MADEKKPVRRPYSITDGYYFVLKGSGLNNWYSAFMIRDGVIRAKDSVSGRIYSFPSNMKWLRWADDSIKAGTVVRAIARSKDK